MSTVKITRLDFVKICRICLEENSTNNMFPIYKLEVLQMFIACTSININSSKELPNQICSVCLSRMTEAYNFKQLCENSNRILLNILKNDDADLESKEEPKPQIKIEEAEIEKDSAYNGKIEDNYDGDNDIKLKDYESDDSITSSKKTIQQSKPLNKNSSNLSTQCKLCNKVLTSASALVRHLRRQHQSDKKYDCDHCNLSFSELHALTSHIKKKHNPEPIFCTVCNKKCFIPQQLDAHMRMFHSTKNDYICSVCGKGFLKGHLLRKHQKHHATERIYHCLQCEKSFKVEATLRLHYKRCHTGERKKEVCTVCGKSVLNIKAHLNTHNNEKSFKCSDCPKVFGNKYNLEEHRKRRHRNPDEPTKRPYLCSICGKGSVSSTALKIHFQHLHTVGKTYPCYICNKKFKTDKGVNAHIRYTHNDDRRYNCTVCLKSFQTSTILRIHMRVHTGERPFVCKLCGKAFGQPSTLKTHMKVHGYNSEKNLKNKTQSADDDNGDLEAEKINNDSSEQKFLTDL